MIVFYDCCFIRQLTLLDIIYSFHFVCVSSDAISFAMIFQHVKHLMLSLKLEPWSKGQFCSPSSHFAICGSYLCMCSEGRNSRFITKLTRLHHWDPFSLQSFQTFHIKRFPPPSFWAKDGGLILLFCNVFLSSRKKKREDGKWEKEPEYKPWILSLCF